MIRISESFNKETTRFRTGCLFFLFHLHPKILPRMLPRQNILLLRHRNMRIDLRHIDGTVAQHLLNIADIHIRVQQAGRKGMAEHMGRDVLLDGGEGGVFVDHPAHGLVGERASGVVDKEMPAGCSFRVNAFVVGAQDADDCFAADLQAAFAASFAVDEDRAVRQIHITYF